MTKVPISLASNHVLKRLAAKKNGAFVWGEQPDNVFQQDALACAALANEGGDFSLVDFKVDLVEDGLVVEAFSDVPEFDQWRFHKCLQNERCDDIIRNKDEHTGHHDG